MRFLAPLALGLAAAATTDPVLFVHVGKTCGGSAVAYLRRAVNVTEVHLRPVKREEVERASHIIVSVRDPTERVVSAFEWHRPGGDRTYGRCFHRKRDVERYGNSCADDELYKCAATADAFADLVASRNSTDRCARVAKAFLAPDAGAKLLGAPVCAGINLSRRVLHAIDATPARWRGGGLAPFDSVIMAVPSRRKDFVKNYQAHPTHWLILPTGALTLREALPHQPGLHLLSGEKHARPARGQTRLGRRGVGVRARLALVPGGALVTPRPHVPDVAPPGPARAVLPPPGRHHGRARARVPRAPIPSEACGELRPRRAAARAGLGLRAARFSEACRPNNLGEQRRAGPRPEQEEWSSLRTVVSARVLTRP